jgi:RNA polymerase sigma-70 factor, ECF subfamily
MTQGRSKKKEEGLADSEHFEECRPRLFAIAYRMLGSVQDAEDIVQEAFLRWSRLDRELVENPQALLCTMVTRMSIDTLRSARKRRETYVGEWLPEPLVNEPLPSDNVALAESLSVAFLVMLERLNPVERAALLLREVFDYDYAAVAVVLEKSESNCRQIVRRARARVRREECRFDPPDDEHAQLLATFLAATQAGEVGELVSMLAEDATLHSDHGGKAQAAKRVIVGADKIARFFVGISTRLMPPDPSVRLVTVNGSPGAITYSGQHPVTVFSVDITAGRIQRVYVVRNPDKLENLPVQMARPI